MKGIQNFRDWVVFLLNGFSNFMLFGDSLPKLSCRTFTLLHFWHIFQTPRTIVGYLLIQASFKLGKHSILLRMSSYLIVVIAHYIQHIASICTSSLPITQLSSPLNMHEQYHVLYTLSRCYLFRIAYCFVAREDIVIWNLHHFDWNDVVQTKICVHHFRRNSLFLNIDVIRVHVHRKSQ